MNVQYVVGSFYGSNCLCLRRGRSRSRSPLGGRVEVDEEELARRARRKERFGVVDSRPERKAEEYDDETESSRCAYLISFSPVLQSVYWPFYGVCF